LCENVPEELCTLMEEEEEDITLSQNKALMVEIFIKIFNFRSNNVTLLQREVCSYYKHTFLEILVRVGSLNS